MEDELETRIRKFLEEQVGLGRDDSYELWGDLQRPDNVITLGDLRQVIDVLRS